METNKENTKAQGVEVKEKKVAIGYTVKSIGGAIERMKEAKLITEEEELKVKEVMHKVAIRYVLGETV